MKGGKSKTKVKFAERTEKEEDSNKENRVTNNNQSKKKKAKKQPNLVQGESRALSSSLNLRLLKMFGSDKESDLTHHKN